MTDDQAANVVLKDLSFRVMAAAFEVHNTAWVWFPGEYLWASAP